MRPLRSRPVRRLRSAGRIMRVFPGSPTPAMGMRRGLSVAILLVFVLGLGDTVASVLCAPAEPASQMELSLQAPGPHPDSGDHGHHRPAHPHDHTPLTEHRAHAPGSHASQVEAESLHDLPEHDPHHQHDCPFGGGSALTCGGAAPVVSHPSPSQANLRAQHSMAIQSPPVLLDGLPGESPFRPPQA